MYHTSPLCHTSTTAYNMLGHPPPSSTDWRLDEGAAALRLIDLLDDVCYPSLLVASPGLVAGAPQRIIEHTCSTFPGMSGAAAAAITSAGYTHA